MTDWLCDYQGWLINFKSITKKSCKTIRGLKLCVIYMTHLMSILIGYHLYQYGTQKVLTYDDTSKKPQSFINRSCYMRSDSMSMVLNLFSTTPPLVRPAQPRKLEGPNYPHKFVTGRKSISFRCGDFVVVWKKFWNDNYLFEVESFCNIFYNWESPHGPEDKLSWAICCAGLL